MPVVLLAILVLVIVLVQWAPGELPSRRLVAHTDICIQRSPYCIVAERKVQAGETKDHARLIRHCVSGTLGTFRTG